MAKIGTFLVNEIRYAGHLQSLGAVAVVAAAAQLTGQPLSLGLLAVPYLLFQAIYWHDRYWGRLHDIPTNRARTLHQALYHHAIPFLVALFALLALGIVLVDGTSGAAVFVLLVGSGGLLYPIIFKSLTRHIPLFKNIYVSAVFAILTLFPSLYGGEPPGSTALALFAGLIFIETIHMQIVLDIKDRKSDAAQHLQTLPVLLGEGATWRTLWIGSGLTAVVAIALARHTDMFAALVLLTLGFLCFNVLLLRARADTARMLTIVAGKHLLALLVFVV